LNKIKAVAALISHGADVNARKGDGETPLMWASRWGHAKVVEALLDAGADKELKANSGGWKGKTALDMARRENKGDVVAILGGKA
jgi:ankyrin repeat protein